jgi:hypothetical protein
MSRRHKRFEQFSTEELDELLNPPSAKGMDRILRFELGKVPETGIPVTGIPATGSLDTGSPAIGRPVTDPPGTDGHAAELLSTEMLETGAAPDSDNYTFQIPASPPKRWTTVQDAHTLGEQALYAALHRLAKPYEPGVRKIIIGLGSLALQVPLSRSNCVTFLESLERKLAIKNGPIAPKNKGREILVYDFEEILKRRRQAGLTHVVRKGRAVTLTPETGIPVTGIPVSETGIPVTGETGIPVTGTHIRNRKSEEGNDDVIRKNDDIARTYEQLTEKHWTEADQATLEEIEGISPIRIKIGIAMSAFRAKQAINSFRYCQGAIMEVSDTPVQDEEQYLKYVISKVAQKRKGAG